MALTNQPYLPLYVDDWMNNNKLKMCSPAAHGIMISIMCIMHKENEYGKVVLKQKFKQTSDQNKNFALQVAKLSAFEMSEVETPLNELLNEGILTIEGETLICPRMVRDCEISLKRSNAGRTGGNSNKDKNFAYPKREANIETNAQAKPEANTVNENGVVNEVVNENTNGNVKIQRAKSQKDVAKKSEIIFPFESLQFKTQWQLWKTYKAKEHNFKYKSEITEQASLVELSNLSDGNEAKAIAIMNQSMTKGWKGFFELKNFNQNGTRGNNSQRSDVELKESANNAVDAMFGISKPS